MSSTRNPPCFEGCMRTDQGLVRSRNQDSGGIYQDVSRSSILAVVADGVGGHPGGDIASQLALRSMMEAAQAGVPARRLAGWLASAARSANRQLRREQSRSAEFARMATTLVALAGRGSTVAIAHLGDSRAYRLRGLRLTLLTTDHTVAQAMLEEGTYSSGDLARSPYRHVLTACLGLKDDSRPATAQLRSAPDDLYLLCSDGLSSALTDEGIRRILLSGAPLPVMAEALIAAANDAGGTDNITVALVRRLNHMTED
jgi:PPM family protein phosphatase